MVLSIGLYTGLLYNVFHVIYQTRGTVFRQISKQLTNEAQALLGLWIPDENNILSSI